MAKPHRIALVCLAVLVGLASHARATECVPDCEGRVCGCDGCGGSCGECLPGEACHPGTHACCQTACDGAACGDDGCGGQCGHCGCGEECVLGQCVFTSCDGLECGPSPCGGVCGECGGGLPCAAGLCCHPECAGRVCGPDGCGGSCGACPEGQWCQQGGCVVEVPQQCAPWSEPGDPAWGCAQCVAAQAPECFVTAWEQACVDLCRSCGQACPCIPNCLYHACGDDGCGGSCGQCGPGEVCNDGYCCFPSCEGRECGDDWCGGSCGTCFGATPVCRQVSGTCEADRCNGMPAAGCCLDGHTRLSCVDNRVMLESCPLPDDSGRVCGWYPGDAWYPAEYVCADADYLILTGDPGGQHPMKCPACTPNCECRRCGDDGCGGSCGECQGCGEACVEGQCLVASCLGRECGDDGCGGSCGQCGAGQVCQEGACCTPDCAGKQCGSNGCGGSCGSCPADQWCDLVQCVDQLPGGCEIPTNAVPGDPSWGCAACVFAQDPGCRDVYWSYGCVLECMACGTCCVHAHCEPSWECGDDGCGGSCGACPAGDDCREHRCCRDECQEDQAGCLDAGTTWLCGQGDTDLCLEQVPTPCGAGSTCLEGACVPTSEGAGEVVEVTPTDTAQGEAESHFEYCGEAAVEVPAEAGPESTIYPVEPGEVAAEEGQGEVEGSAGPEVSEAEAAEVLAEEAVGGGGSCGVAHRGRWAWPWSLAALALAGWWRARRRA